MTPDRFEISQCPNCQSHTIDKYCSNCGQKIYRKRFTLRSFFEVIGNALNIERGFVHTLFWMFKNPGKVINDYLNGKTKAYFNPLNYVLIIAGIYAFLAISLNIIDTSYETTNSMLHADSAIPSPETQELQQRWFDFVKRYANLIPLLMIPFASLFSKWFYNKRKLYFGEHLIINSYIFAQNLLISILFTPAVVLFPVLLKVFPVISICLTLMYFAYAFYRTFKQSVIKAFLGAISIYFGGFLLFMLLIMILVLIAAIAFKILGISPFDLIR